MTAAAIELVPALAALRDLAIETLFQLMNSAASPKDRRLAAIAALRYIAQQEKSSSRDRDTASRAGPVAKLQTFATSASPPAQRDAVFAEQRPQAGTSRPLTSTGGREPVAACDQISLHNLLDSLSPPRARSRRVAGAIALAAGAAPALGP